jgi:hypothetical protein
MAQRGRQLQALQPRTICCIRLILDLLEWIGGGSRPYSEVMDARRTSCPRLPVWEDATERGFIRRHHEEGVGEVISVTRLGREHLSPHRPRRDSTAGR